MIFKRMREQILDKAIRGQLVPQLAEDGVVDQIGEAPTEVPFDIPDSWKWLTLESLSIKIGDGLHGTPEYVEDSCYFFINGNNLRDGKIVVDEKTKRISFDTYQRLHVDLDSSTLLLSINGTIGSTAFYNDEKVALGKSACYINLGLDLDKYFLNLVVKSKYFEEFAKNKSTGTTIRNLGLKAIRSWYIPLPPLAEQKRIASKIKSLFGEIDRAEKAYEELQSLANVLRGQILQKAIQGKLVPQQPEDGVVEQIGEAPAEVPFELPASWKWASLNNIGTIVSGATPKTSVAEFWNGDINWVTPADLGKISSKWISHGSRFLTKAGLKSCSAVLMPKGSIVYSSRAPIGHIAIAANELCTNQGCKSFVPKKEYILTEWAYYILIARTKDIQSRASGTTFKEISGTGMGNTLIPLPPLAEQKRIVAKIEALFEQIDLMTK